MYLPYADNSYYSGAYGGELIEGEADKYLKAASRHIDALTYNRIAGRGFDRLTGFQQEIIREVCCEMAEFEYENADIIQSVLQSYSINGVSMSFGSSWNVKVAAGVAVKADTYAKLEQTGLCCPVLRGRW